MRPKAGASFYLLGSGGPGAAILPPLKGVFFDNTAYYYNGKSGRKREFAIGGNMVAGLETTVVADFPTVLGSFKGRVSAIGATAAQHEDATRAPH